MAKFGGVRQRQDYIKGTFLKYRNLLWSMDTYAWRTEPLVVSKAKQGTPKGSKKCMQHAAQKQE